MRRAVITGLGLITPLGCGVEICWKRLIAGESGVRALNGPGMEKLRCRVGGEIPSVDAQAIDGQAADGQVVGGQVAGGKAAGVLENGAEGLFNADDWSPPHERRKMCLFILYALVAARQALADSGWKPENEEQCARSGVIVGSGIGGLQGIYDNAVAMVSRGPRRVSPFFIPSCLINEASGRIAIEHGLRGPNHAVVTACSSGAHAIGDAARMIAHGDVDVMVAGGAESTLTPFGIAGFESIRALSTHFNDEPSRASRPWDMDRDGFVMGEGAGVVVVEEYEHARRRGAPIYAEIFGYGMSGDAFHVTAPAEDGAGAERAMRAALKDAGVSSDDIDYINAHGTSTPVGDDIEIAAVRRVFNDSPPAVSSTKSSIGHLLGASGSVEAIFSLLAIRDSVVPPTLNLEKPSPACKGLNLVPFEAQPRKVRRVMSNSFGFGGTNACLVIGSPT